MREQQRQRNMSNELVSEIVQAIQGAQREQKLHLVEVVRHEGPGIQLPDGLDYRDAINIFHRKIREEEEFVDLHASVNASPFDGAYALYRALNQMFGLAVQTEDRWGDRDNIQVVVDARGNTVNVPYGSFRVPGVEGEFESSHTEEDGRIIFKIKARIQGKARPVFNELVKLTRQMIATSSIYRGQALDARFSDSRGNREAIPAISFIDVSNAPMPIFDEEIAEQLEHDVFYYINFANAVRKRRGSVKRGILLAGEYGVGKTMTARHIAQLATRNGFTFIYAKKPTDLAWALDFAQMYQPAIVFVEDIEKAAGRERTSEVDRISLKMDGVDNKRMDIITIATTNNLSEVNEVLRRPGRFDFTLMMTAPKARAALQIASLYARQDFPYELYADAGENLSGMIPAVIEEAVSRAQNRADARGHGEPSPIQPVDLLRAARSVQAERELNKVPPTRDDEDQLLIDFATTLGDRFGGSFGDALDRLVSAIAHNPAIIGQLGQRSMIEAHTNGHETVAVR